MVLLRTIYLEGAINHSIKGNPIKLTGASDSLIPLSEYMELTKWVRRSQAEFERDAQTCAEEFEKLLHEGQLDYPNCELEFFTV